MMYAVLAPAWFAELGVPPGDTEGLIDSLRAVDGVEIACLIQPEADGVRLSLRARSPACPVDGIAHELGGGGHALASGARLAGVSAAEAERVLLEKTGKVLAR
jgi:phosphoesterase RecJ-like protein